MNEAHNGGALWSKDEEDRACKWREEGKKVSDIARRLKRSGFSVKAKLASLGATAQAPSKWTDAQLQFMADNLSLSDAELSEAVSKLGAFRSPSAIKSKRRYVAEWSKGAMPRKVGGRGVGLTDGWPTLKGSHEERDAQFAIRVIEAKHFCGLIQDRRLVELMIDDVTRGLQRRKAAA